MIAQRVRGIDQYGLDLAPRRLLRLDRRTPSDISARSGSIEARFGSVLASPDSTDRAAR